MNENYKKTSVYSKTKINKKYLETYQPPITINFENTRTIELTAKHNMRPDVLAYELYEDASLWWVFTLYNRNKIQDPIFDFKPGLKIRVPINTSSIGV